MSIQVFFSRKCRYRFGYDKSKLDELPEFQNEVERKQWENEQYLLDREWYIQLFLKINDVRYYNAFKV